MTVAAVQDGSGTATVLRGTLRDTSATFTPFPCPGEHKGLADLAGRDPLARCGVLSTFAKEGHAAVRAELNAIDAPAALLDRPLSPSARAFAEPEAPWILTGMLWPAMQSAAEAGLDLVSLSLTLAPGSDARALSRAFGMAVAAASPLGALMVLDRGSRGADHFHGIAMLARQRDALTVWCNLSGAQTSRSRLTPITGWREHLGGGGRVLLGNVGSVLGYAFKAWPQEHGARCIREDVAATGALAPLWAGVLATLDAGDTRRPSTGRTPCRMCGGAIPAGKRSHATWCSTACRKKAFRVRSKQYDGRRGTESTPPKGQPLAGTW